MLKAIYTRYSIPEICKELQLWESGQFLTKHHSPLFLIPFIGILVKDVISDYVYGCFPSFLGRLHSQLGILVQHDVQVRAFIQPFPQRAYECLLLSHFAAKDRSLSLTCIESKSGLQRLVLSVQFAVLPILCTEMYQYNKGTQLNSNLLISLLA